MLLLIFWTCVLLSVYHIHVNSLQGSVFHRQICYRRQNLSNQCATDASTMNIDEIKSELELRGVDFSDCVSKKELIDLLRKNRTIGRANPDIIKKFNELRTESNDDLDDILNSDITKEVVAKDGSLPGGMSPELMKALASDKDISTMLRDPKMQDIMSAVMTGGPQAMQKYLADPDALLLLDRLNKAISRTMGSKMK